MMLMVIYVLKDIQPVSAGHTVLDSRRRLMRASVNRSCRRSNAIIHQHNDDKFTGGKWMRVYTSFSPSSSFLCVLCIWKCSTRFFSNIEKFKRRRRRNWAGIQHSQLFTKAYRIGITHGLVYIGTMDAHHHHRREENIFFFSFMLEDERKKEESKRQELPVGVIIQRVNGRLGPLATGNRPTHAIFSYTIITSGCFGKCF